MRSLFLLLIATVFVLSKEIVFGVVPQQSPSKLLKTWKPIVSYLSKETGLKVVFKTEASIPKFEKALYSGKYDIAYMNPYHYTVYSNKPGYIAFAKALNKKIKGIVVVKKDSPIKSLEQLSGQKMAFPAPAAFAASVLPRAHFSKSNIPITPKYVSSHDSVYRSVAKGLFPAGGGVKRTFNNVAPEIREQLTILWTTKGYTPHAFAAHPQLDKQLVQKIQTAMLNLDKSDKGKKLLKSIKLKGIMVAHDKDWDDVRGLNIDLLNN